MTTIEDVTRELEDVKMKLEESTKELEYLRSLKEFWDKEKEKLARKNEEPPTEQTVDEPKVEEK